MAAVPFLVPSCRSSPPSSPALKTGTKFKLWNPCMFGDGRQWWFQKEAVWHHSHTSQVAMSWLSRGCLFLEPQVWDWECHPLNSTKIVPFMAGLGDPLVVANQQPAEFAGFELRHRNLEMRLYKLHLYTVLCWLAPNSLLQGMLNSTWDRPQIRTRHVQVEEACTVSSKALRYTVTYLATVANAWSCANVSEGV